MHRDTLRLTTFRDFLETEQGLEYWCVGCRRSVAAEVAMLVRNGLGDRQVKRCRPRCRKYGSREAVAAAGALTVR